jgi:signal transduction histidine kinase
MRWPIRNQIMLPLLAAAVVSLTAVGVINAVLAERRTCAHVEQQLRQVISVLTTSSFPLTNSVLRQMRDLSDAEFVLVDASGGAVASTLPTSTALPERSVTRQIEDVQLGSSDEIAGRWYFHTVMKLPVGASTMRSGTLHVLFPQDEYRRAWREAFLPSLIVGLGTTLLLATVAYALAKRMGRTIGRLREEVLRIAHGDFRAAELPAVDDEIRDLSVAVNRTAAMLAEYEQQVRQSEQMRTLTVLGASIAHQLRNAVTGCRMALDLHDAACPAKEGNECLEVAGRQLRLMESQLQRFLRIGKRPTKLESREVEVGNLIEELLPLVRPAGQHAGVSLDCRIAAAALTIQGDEEALSQVMLNLLLNAIEAAQQNAIESPTRGSVEIDVRLSDDDTDSVAIEIRDSGAGPSESVAASLFEPFVTSKAEGAGLGLAVAREIVEAHGGTIDWKRENGMTRFCVEIPLARSRCESVQNSHSG